MLSVAHDLAGSPIEIPVSLEADDRRRTEHFTQFDARRIDLLFVVDNSCSMDEEQAELGVRFARVPRPRRGASRSTTRWRSPRPTWARAGPGGAFVGSPAIITQETPGPRHRVRPERDGRPRRRRRRAGTLRLQARPLLPADRDRQRRLPPPEASLAVVYVSDEDDQSPGSVMDTADFLLGLPAGAVPSDRRDRPVTLRRAARPRAQGSAIWSCSGWSVAASRPSAEQTGIRP